MIARYGIGLVTGTLVTFGLLWLMQYLIATGKDALTDDGGFKFVDVVRVQPDEVIDTIDRKPEKPPEPDEPPPDQPPPQTDSFDANVATINVGRARANVDINIGGIGGFDTMDGEYLPIARVEPIYPRRAASRGLEGHCDVTFTVTRLGTVIDPVAECTSSVFKRASEQAVLKWKFKPRVVNGEPIESPGVTNRLTFNLED